jgi:hypothetical protein
MTDPQTQEASEPAPIDPRAWGARFGWIVGAVLGLALAFAATYGIETWVFHGGPAATEAAARVARWLFPAGFLVGSLSGHAFGARGGATRYKSLGVAAGIGLLTLLWALLSIAR